jgi:hypothetical protein
MDSSLQTMITMSPFTSSLCIVMMEVMHAQKSPMFGVKNNFQIIKRLHLTSYIRIIYLSNFS